MNLLRRINTSESSSYDTFLFNLKPSLGKKFLVDRGAKVAPIHGPAEEVIFSISRPVVFPGNCKQEEATGPKPLCKSTKEAQMLLSWDMSKLHAGNSVSITSAVTNLAVGTFFLARAIMFEEMSIPVKLNAPARCWATGIPAPHPTSRIFELGSRRSVIKLSSAPGAVRLCPA